MVLGIIAVALNGSTPYASYFTFGEGIWGGIAVKYFLNIKNIYYLLNIFYILRYKIIVYEKMRYFFLGSISLKIIHKKTF